MKKTKFLCIAALGTLAVLGTSVGAVVASGQLFTAIAGQPAERNFALTIDKDNFTPTTEHEGASHIVKSVDSNYPMQFKVDGTLEAVEGKLGTLKKGSVIRNIDKVKGIKNIHITDNVNEGNVYEISYGWTKNDKAYIVNRGIGIGGDYNNFDERPTFIEIKALQDVTIDYIKMDYSCDEATLPSKYTRTAKVIGQHKDGVWGEIDIPLVLNTDSDNRTHQEFMAKKVEFKADDLFKIVSNDGKDDKYVGSEVFQTNPGSAFDSGDLVDDGTNDHNIKVVKAGTYEIYYKYEIKDGKHTQDSWIPAITKVEPKLFPATVYLKPNANWKKDNARFAAYICNATGKDTWVDAVKVEGETDIYSVAIPEGFRDNFIIFCRMNPGEETNDWSSKWNQTDNLYANKLEGSNLYTIAEDAWDKGGGTWSVFTPKKTA